MPAGACGPSTATPENSTRATGKRRRKVRSIIYRIAARACDQADGKGYAGKGSFRAGSARPSADSFRARFATCNRSCPSPTGANENTSKFMRPLAAYSVNLPVSSTSWPTATCTPAAREAVVPHHARKACRLVLDREVHGLVPGLFDSSEISPTRHTVTPSSAPFASCMAADTDKAREADSCVEAPPVTRSRVRTRRLMRSERGSAGAGRLLGVSRRARGSPELAKSRGVCPRRCSMIDRRPRCYSSRDCSSHSSCRMDVKAAAT